MTVLRKRKPLHSGTSFNRQHPAAKAFHQPQRDLVAAVEYPKPRCGVCGGKVHTKTDYRAPAPSLHMRRTYGHPRKSDWWVCADCDPGVETGMPRAA